MSYEEAVKKLEAIIEKLENSTLPLGEALSLFEEANKLAKSAQEELSNATGKLLIIKKELDKVTEEEL